MRKLFASVVFAAFIAVNFAIIKKKVLKKRRDGSCGIPFCHYKNRPYPRSHRF